MENDKNQWIPKQPHSGKIVIKYLFSSKDLSTILYYNDAAFRDIPRDLYEYGL